MSSAPQAAATPSSLAQHPAVRHLHPWRGVRRDVRRAGPAARPLRGALRPAAGGRRRRDAPAPVGRRSRLPAPGHHLHRLRPQRGHRAHLPLRPDPAADHRRRMERARTRADPAHHRPQPVPERRLRQREGARRRRHPPRPGLQLQALPPRDAGRRRAPRRLRLGGRHRPGAAARRVVRGARGQPAGAERGELHAHQPPGDQAGVPAALQQLRRPSRRSLRPGPAGDAAGPGPGAPARADDRAAHAGGLQLRLLRTHLPGPADGHRAGRGPRPVRARQRRLHADHRRPAASRRDLPPRRRRLHRPAGLPRRLDARAFRGCSTPTGPATSR